MTTAFTRTGGFCVITDQTHCTPAPSNQPPQRLRRACDAPVVQTSVGGRATAAEIRGLASAWALLTGAAPIVVTRLCWGCTDAVLEAIP
jgi:hypothetical protein